MVSFFCAGDRPLVVQFAATNAIDFAGAAELVAPFADGIDLNCGCPQRWALSDGYGAALIKEPELVADMVQQARSRSNLPISIKIRIHNDLRCLTIQSANIKLQLMVVVCYNYCPVIIIVLSLWLFTLLSAVHSIAISNACSI